MATHPDWQDSDAAAGGSILDAVGPIDDEDTPATPPAARELKPQTVLTGAQSPLLSTPVKRATEQKIRQARDAFNALTAALVATNGLDDLIEEIAADPATATVLQFDTAAALVALSTLRTAAVSAGLVTQSTLN